MQNLTIAFFSYSTHQDFLVPGLRSIYRYAPTAREIVLVWDDFVRARPVNFDLIREQSGVEFRVVLQSEITSWPKAIGEWGWIKQQLAKLSCYLYTTTKYTWIIDGDVILRGDPELFHPDGRPYLRYDIRATDAGYVHFIKRYLGFQNFYPHDFVGSTCLFDNQECKKIHDYVLESQGMSLTDCVNQCITEPNHHEWPFSEFETYGTWIINTCPESHVLAPRNWKYAAREYNLDCPIQIGYTEKELS